MILASTPEEEASALDELRKVQTEDFASILRAMSGLPVTVRLLDPPLHEFLPRVDELEIKKATVGLTAEETKLSEAAHSWAEVNPMLGTRGVRLGVVKPGLYAMQVRALLAAADIVASEGYSPIVEVMIPLIVNKEELALARSWVEQEILAHSKQMKSTQKFDTQNSAKKSIKKSKQPKVTIGTMIETPRAALVAGELAEISDFFSFGTNDLTQMTFGFSRDDVESRMMPAYLEAGLLKRNPFETIDQVGVGELVKIAANRGRKAKRGIKLGVCGEHGGDPESIGLFYRAGLDYVSCSPYRIPIARLASAQAIIGGSKTETK
jgi:pyruvate,orthophosphate dikinase